MMVNKSLGLQVATVAKVPVYLKSSWFLLMALICLGYGFYLVQVFQVEPSHAFTLSTSAAVLVALGVLVHELAHAFTGKLFGLRVEYISMTLWGGVTRLSPGSPLTSLLISLSGPLVNLLYAGGLFLAASNIEQEALKAGVFLAAEANLLVSFFNMVPSYPLDGGHALEAVLTLLTKRRASAARATAWVGLALLPLLAAVAVYTGLWHSRYGLILLVLLGWYVWSGSYPMLRALDRQKNGKDPLSVQNLTRRALILPIDADIASLQRLWDGSSPVLLVRGQDALAWLDSDNATLLLEGHSGASRVVDLAYELAPPKLSSDMLRIDLMEYYNGYHYQNLPEQMRQGYLPLAWAVQEAGSPKTYLGLLTHRQISQKLGQETGNHPQ